jgi:hypothetical protein
MAFPLNAAQSGPHAEPAKVVNFAQTFQIARLHCQLNGVMARRATDTNGDAHGQRPAHLRFASTVVDRG